MVRLPEGLKEQISSKLTLKRSQGVYWADGRLYTVSLSRNFLGKLSHDEGNFELATLPSESDELQKVFSPVDDGQIIRYRVVGLPANDIGFLSYLADENSHAPVDDGEDEEVEESRNSAIQSDSVEGKIGKNKVVATASIDKRRLTNLLPITNISRFTTCSFEPAPWAAWRASLMLAPLKPRKGIHLRFLLGDGQGLAILGSNQLPLAWQVLFWDGSIGRESLVQAFLTLSHYSLRRLSCEIDHVSVQGHESLSIDWESLEISLKLPVSLVAGPAYGPELISYGLALTPFDGKRESLDLAKSLQPERSILSLIPWGEAMFMSALFVCLYLFLCFHSSNLSGELAELERRNKRVVWSNGMKTSALKKEATELRAKVAPIEKFIKRDFLFSSVFIDLPHLIPEKIWVLTVQGDDQIWTNNPDKSRGNQFIIFRMAAPFVPGESVPREIDETLENFEQHEFFKRNLPVLKVAEINWRKKGAEGMSVFSVLGLPKTVKRIKRSSKN